MLLPFFLAAGAALLFYLLLPVAGAFRVRKGWRRFRESLMRAHAFPALRYRDIAAGISGASPGGCFTLRGIIEAFEGERIVWIRGEEVSAAVDLGSAPLHILIDDDRGDEGKRPHPGGGVERHPWSSIRLLSEGTRVFIGGRLFFSGGKPLFRDEPGEPLVAIAYGCPDQELLRRAIAGARHPNEYWNPLTRVSLVLGLVAGSLILLLGARLTPFPTVRALAFLAAASPALPLLPPGFLLFFLYRRWWRRALEYRIERDLAALHAATAPVSAESRRLHFARRAAFSARVAGACLIASVFLNGALIFLVWRYSPGN